MQFFKTLMNLGKIKEYAKVLLVVVTKARNILEFLEEELKETSVGDKVKEYLPKVKSAITVVIESVTKVLSFFGEDVTVSQSTSTVEQEVEELEKAVKSLKRL